MALLDLVGTVSGGRIVVPLLVFLAVPFALLAYYFAAVPNSIKVRNAIAVI